MAWVLWVILTISTWGLYGVFLHQGVISFGGGPGGDPDARFRAFLFVGIAYFLTAVVAPIVVMVVRGASFEMTGGGMSWSLLAGIVGAIGAFCVLLAFGAGGRPAVVMSLIFAFAPIVNAVAAMVAHPPDWSTFRWPFVLGIIMAAVGGGLVLRFKPTPAKHDKPAAVETLAPATTAAKPIDEPAS